MNAWISLFMVLALMVLAWIGGGVPALQPLFGVVIPYAAMVIFLAGVVWKILSWAKSPVPFPITTTCGQQRSLDWIKTDKLENPPSKWWVVARMALEILFFRSLFRNTKADLKQGPRLVYGPEKYLWMAALAFHWSFLIIFVRHYRFFAEPIPAPILLLQDLDGLLQIGVPVLYLTDLLIVAGLTFLFVRRVISPQVRYISLPADFFPLFLLLGIVLSGICMRYFFKIDIVAAKELAMGLVRFSPSIPEEIGVIFFIHLFFVSVLMAYFPFSKLMHMGGVFLSPTRNMRGDSRSFRHVNPWNYPVKVHTYEEYEDDFRDVMRAAELPLERDE